CYHVLSQVPKNLIANSLSSQLILFACYPAIFAPTMLKGNGHTSQITDGGDEVFSCWQLLANYCVKTEPFSESTTNTGRMDTHLIIQSISSDVLSSETARSAQMRIKTYGTELAVVCVLLAVCVLSFGLSVAYRHRGRMKEVLRGGEQTGGAQKSTVRPGESLPLNAGALPTSPSDHKSYQTLEESCGYIIASSETSTQNNSKEAETLAQTPQNGFKESHVEVSDICPRPRRLCAY
ncbi:hypothetical protein M9458_015412, partial [Cirrhinus mrigala]